MKVILYNDSFPPLIDGVANTVVNYAAIINNKYGEAMVATPKYPGADDSKFPFYVMRYASLNTAKLVGYRAGFPFGADALHIQEQFAPDLLHSHCPVASTFMARAVRQFAKVPVIFTYHTKFDIDFNRAIKNKFISDACIKAMVQNIEACDDVWAVNEGAAENLKSLGYSGEITIMKNGVDIDRTPLSEDKIRDLDTTYNLPAGVPVFLFVGRIMWYKGLKIVLDGLKGIADRGLDFRMVFVGDGDNRLDVEKYARELGLGDRCIFPGVLQDRDQLKAWYTRADVFMLPSVFDNNPLVVKEAAACGTPSVLIENSSSADGVTDGYNGFLIPEDAEAMTQTLLKIYENPELASKVGYAASQTLYCSWEDSIAKAYDRYNYILDMHKKGELPLRSTKLGMIPMITEVYKGIEKIREFYRDDTE